MKHSIAAFLLCAGVLCSTRAADLHVDNVRGREKGLGTQEAPFTTIGEALKVLKSGDTLHLAANEGVPYEEVIDTHPAAKWGGTPEKPTIIDGHGATITGLRHFPAADWKDEGDGIFSRRLPNNAWSMDQQGYWSGHPIVFFDGQPAEFRKDKASLTERSYFLHKDPQHPPGRSTKLHNTLYIKLPTGKTPDDVKVVSIGARTILHLNCSYINVKNLTIVYASEDAFATTHCKGVVFDNIRGAYCMDQGISNHGAQALVKNSRFDHNTVSGIVDVYPEAEVRYTNCVVENNLRGGVEFYSGEYAMENCIIRHNKGAGITVNRDAKVRLSNCYVDAEAEEKKFAGVDVGPGCLTMEHCTIYKAGAAVASFLSKNPETFAVTNCAFINNRINLNLIKAKEGVEATNIQFGQNTYTPGEFRVFGTTYGAHQWDDYRQEIGFDGDSLMQAYQGTLPPHKTGLTIDTHRIGCDVQSIE